MSALYEKIASLPPSLLPMVENFVDSLPTANDGRDARMKYPELVPRPADENGKPKQRKFGCMKGVMGMADNFDVPMELVQTIRPMKKTLTPGCMKGKIRMADDFDAPLEDFPKPDTRKTPKPDCMKGRIWMADDFDAPLEEFEEYM